MELIYDDGWSSYEEYGHLEIFQEGLRYFIRKSGYTVMESPGEWESDIYEVSEDEAYEEFLEMEEGIEYMHSVMR